MSKYYICKSCGGWGENVFISHWNGKPFVMAKCDDCGGMGVLDWLRNIVSPSRSEAKRLRTIPEEEIKSKWREVSPGKWERLDNEDRRGREIGIGKSGRISYGEIR